MLSSIVTIFAGIAKHMSYSPEIPNYLVAFDADHELG
jgi:hypothetical protein